MHLDKIKEELMRPIMQNDILTWSWHRFITGDGKNELIERLDEKALDGWRLVQVVKSEGDLLHYLERTHPHYPEGDPNYF